MLKKMFEGQIAFSVTILGRGIRNSFNDISEYLKYSINTNLLTVQIPDNLFN